MSNTDQLLVFNGDDLKSKLLQQIRLFFFVLLEICILMYFIYHSISIQYVFLRVFFCHHYTGQLQYLDFVLFFIMKTAANSYKNVILEYRILSCPPFCVYNPGAGGHVKTAAMIDIIERMNPWMTMQRTTGCQLLWTKAIRGAMCRNLTPVTPVNTLTWRLIRLHSFGGKKCRTFLKMCVESVFFPTF